MKSRFSVILKEQRRGLGLIQIEVAMERWIKLQQLSEKQH